MNYQVSRNGQMYGPYTFEDLQRYVASGNILPSDMAKNDEMTEWVPVSQILGGAAAQVPPAQSFPTGGYAAPAAGFATPGYADPAYNPVGAPGAALASSPYPDAPNLHWGLVLLFSILTCTMFMYIWNLVVAAWLKKVQPNATSLFYYIGAAVLLVVQVAVGGFAHSQFNFGAGDPTHHFNPAGSLIGLVVWVVRLVARFSQRASLEEHFNGPEPVGLQLNPVMTFFFGGLYFQSQLNRINAMKQAARMGMGRGY